MRTSPGTVALVALAAAVFGGRLAAGDLAGDPVIYAALAKAIVARRDWGTLYLAGVPFFDKPPLVMWLTAISFLAFGSSSWSARLPGVACSIGSVLATARVASRIAGPRAGLVAGAILALTPGFVRYGSTLLLDPPFVLCALAGFLAMLDAWDDRGGGLWRAGAWFGAAFMAKGPQTLVLPAILVVTWAVSPRRDRSPFRALVAAGAAFVVVALPWCLYELWRWDGAFVRGAISDVGEKLGPQASPAVSLHILAVTSLPWLPFAATGMWRTLRDPRRDVPTRLLVVWTALGYGILLMTAKHSPRYVMLLHPAIAIWSALAVAPWLPEVPRIVRGTAGIAAIAWLVTIAWPGNVHPTGVREAVVALEPALPPAPTPIQGFGLRDETMRGRLYFYLGREVWTRDDRDAVRRLPAGTAIVTRVRGGPTLAGDPDFVEAKRTRDFVVFNRAGPAGSTGIR